MLQNVQEEKPERLLSRREIRDCIFRLLFRVEFHQSGEMEEQKELFLEDMAEDESESAGDFPREISDKDKHEVAKKYDAIADKLPEIDAMINDKATGWSSKRMGKAELTIIRLAVYEIYFDERIPTGVAINEAVELAKNYGQDGSAAFVNGVLAKFAGKIQG